jgi:hypothetical protein
VDRRLFEDEQGGIWTVTKQGSTLDVKGPTDHRETLHQIARSCARKLGVTRTSSGIPLEYVNEHRRIWNCIWDRGRPQSAEPGCER